MNSETRFLGAGGAPMDEDAVVVFDELPAGQPVALGETWRPLVRVLPDMQWLARGEEEGLTGMVEYGLLLAILRPAFYVHPELFQGAAKAGAAQWPTLDRLYRLMRTVAKALAGSQTLVAADASVASFWSAIEEVRPLFEGNAELLPELTLRRTDVWTLEPEGWLLDFSDLPMQVMLEERPAGAPRPFRREAAWVEYTFGDARCSGRTREGSEAHSAVSLWAAALTPLQGDPGSEHARPLLLAELATFLQSFSFPTFLRTGGLEKNGTLLLVQAMIGDLVGYASGDSKAQALALRKHFANALPHLFPNLAWLHALADPGSDNPAQVGIRLATGCGFLLEREVTHWDEAALMALDREVDRIKVTVGHHVARLALGKPEGYTPGWRQVVAAVVSARQECVQTAGGRQVSAQGGSGAAVGGVSESVRREREGLLCQPGFLAAEERALAAVEAHDANRVWKEVLGGGFRDPVRHLLGMDNFTYRESIFRKLSMYSLRKTSSTNAAIQAVPMMAARVALGKMLEHPTVVYKSPDRFLVPETQVHSLATLQLHDLPIYTLLVKGPRFQRGEKAGDQVLAATAVQAEWESFANPDLINIGEVLDALGRVLPALGYTSQTADGTQRQVVKDLAQIQAEFVRARNQSRMAKGVLDGLEARAGRDGLRVSPVLLARVEEGLSLAAAGFRDLIERAAHQHGTLFMAGPVDARPESSLFPEAARKEKFQSLYEWVGEMQQLNNSSASQLCALYLWAAPQGGPSAQGGSSVTQGAAGGTFQGKANPSDPGGRKGLTSTIDGDSLRVGKTFFHLSKVVAITQGRVCPHWAMVDMSRPAPVGGWEDLCPLRGQPGHEGPEGDMHLPALRRDPALVDSLAWAKSNGQSGIRAPRLRGKGASAAGGGAAGGGDSAGRGSMQPPPPPPQPSGHRSYSESRYSGDNSSRGPASRGRQDDEWRRDDGASRQSGGSQQSRGSRTGSVHSGRSPTRSQGGSSHRERERSPSRSRGSQDGGRREDRGRGAGGRS